MPSASNTNGVNGVKSPMTSSISSSTKGMDGFHTPPMSPSSPRVSKGRGAAATRGFSSASSTGLRSQAHGSTKIQFVEDTAIALKRKSMSELGAGVSQSVEATSFINLVEWIRQERLSTLPHKGSRWDTVLIRALYFADHFHAFETAIQSSANGSTAAAQLGYGHVRLLLELGHENSEALDKAFGFFYKCSLMASSLLARSEMLSVTSETREQLCMMFTDLLTLVVEVATRFYKTVHGMMAGSVSLDMYEVFGDTIETFRDRRGKTSDLIWSYQIENEGINSDETVAIESLSKWLAPQDRVLDMLGSDHTTFADDQVEYTCLWFQDELTKFVKGSDECLLINARAGSGKTTLAASLIDRLQRPVARKSYSTLFCSIGSASSQANSLHVVNSLLYQLLNIRVGNMALYHALVRAYHHARQTADPKAYEDHLWNALKDALQHPLDNGNDTVLVINGLDDVQGGQSTGQALLDRLTQVVSDAKRTKMIALSKSLSLRSGTRGAQRNISPDDTRDDMHNVAIRSLARCRHFTSKAGPDQETIIANIIDAASGSFLWTILACETLKTEKTTEGFGKVVQSLKTQPPQSADLVSKLVSVLQPNADSALLLSWVVGAARPLTYDELQDLFAIDPQNPTNSNKRVDVHSLVQSIKPLLTLHHDVVRVRHTLVQTTLQTLLDQGKVPVPVKDRHTDMLLRILAYAKVTLHEKGDPTLDDTDQSLPARLFPRHHLLEYVIRYWPIHLKQTPMSPSGSSEPKPSPELQKVFPDSTMMPILEWLCWDAQYPGAQEVELHVLVGRLRKTIFTENHPTVLQSYINTATYYESMGNDREASKYYFLAITIAQNVLSQFHPVTIDCANRFLGLTEPMTTTSRTEVMTQRERVLLILISAYERQFGVSSELVIQTRQLLIDFYMHIHEEDHATDLIRVVRGTTAEKHGRDSDQGRDASNHLRVSLGNGKKRETLDTRKDGLFHDGEEEDETEEDFTLERVTVLRRVAEDYISQKKFLEAEQTYVLLWQQLSQRCRTTLSTDWHEKKIETVNAYAKFLKSQKRETETSAILVCLAQEYERHELSWSENIITRLLESAQTLKRAGHSTAALSIWRQASSYYKSTRKEQSSSFQQIEEEISVTSTEVLKHAVSSASTTDKTNTVSESSMESVFRSMIINTSKSIDISTMTIAKRLSTQYIEQRKWTEAISVIHSTLHRTWESFFAASLHDIQITTTFLQESVELVERLAEVYLQQRLLEKVIDVYTRLFRAALTSPRQHRDLLEKAKTLVIGFYDKYGYPDKAISIFQELLAVFRRVYGPNHDLTIQVLYELGTRCRTYARTHPYWIEYYQQISTAVNKDSDICHVSSIDAVILVATSYWEERRYTEAITSFTLLWNTFVKKTKEYKQFSDASFVQRLYERYAQSLEATQAEWDTLYRVTKQYQETCVTAFGAESAIYVSATLTLARVAESSEKHLDEAITLFETASKSKSKSSTKEDSVEIRRTVTKLYKRRITSSSSASSESVTKAVSVYQEQLAESKSQYGYAHSSTLNSLRELVMLQCRQQKTDVAVKEMITAVSEIITKETSDEKMLESASSIASMFQASQQTQPCTELVQELHRQLIAKEKRKSSKYTFDLTSSSSASLVFLAGLEYNIRSNTSLTFSEILSDIIAEHVYYEQFRRTMKARSGLDKIVMVAAPLRHFLLQRNRKDLAQSLEEQIVQLFIQRDTADLKLLSNESPKIFIVGILDHLGNRKLTNFVRAVILASNNSLSKLIENNKFAEGYDVANIAFIYAQYHKGYTQPKSISRGFELASYLDGRGENRCPDPALRKKLLQLSNSIIKEILNICHQQNINMAQVQLPELNQLIALLGEQGDYETLESLLTSLWNTRDAQRSWPSRVLINLGQRLICARYLAGHHIKALRLCEDITYNLRRVHGARHPATLEAYGLLAQLYTSTGQHYQKSAEKDKNSGTIAASYFKKAVLVHEDVLRLLVSEGGEGAGAEDDDDEDTAAAILKEHGVVVDEDNDGRADELDVDKGKLVKEHLRLMKLAYQRLGSWPKQYSAYERLNADAFKAYGAQLSGVEGVEKWQVKGFGAGKAESNDGAFVGVSEWEILSTQLRQELEAEEHEEL